MTQRYTCTSVLFSLLVQEEITDEEDKDILRQHDVKFGPAVAEDSNFSRKRKHPESQKYGQNCYANRKIEHVESHMQCRKYDCSAILKKTIVLIIDC